MRIVQVTGLVSLKYGGFERWILAMADRCALRGHRLYTIWERRPTSEAFLRDLAATGTEVIVLPAVGRPVQFLAQMTAWLLRNPVDVLHTHFQPAAILSLMAGRIAKVSLSFCTMHSSLLPEQKHKLPIKSEIVARVRRSLATRMFAVSDGVSRDYCGLGYGGRPMDIRYIGVAQSPANPEVRSTIRRQLGLDDSDIVVGCVAFHAPVKGVDLLLKAFREALRAVPTLRLIQVGTGITQDETDSLISLAKELGVSDRVMWLGLRDDVSSVLQACDLYCQPSRSEGISLSIIEAMSAGLPVVATSVGGIPEAVVNGNTGLLVKSESPPDLAESICRLALAPEMRHRMGQEGLCRAQSIFDVKRQTGALIAEYEAMLAIIDG